MAMKLIFLSYYFFLALNIVTIVAQKPILRSGSPSIFAPKPILRGGLDYDDRNDQLDVLTDRYNVPKDRHYSGPRPRPREVRERIRYSSSDELQPTTDLKRELMAVLLLDQLKKTDHNHQRTDSDTDTDSTSSGTDVSSEDRKSGIFNILRKSVWKSCSKSAVKVCKKACESAVSSACSSYDCKKKLKKTLKKRCKESCKDRFTTD